MTFLKPLHLFEVYLFESTKKNAFSIMNSEPTSTIRKKIYADRYEVSSGGLTFYQSVKNASDEIEEVPVISFPAGKWESVSLIRNRIIIAEHKTGASTGASHTSVQAELKKNKPATNNSFKIIQMPPKGQETERELGEINKLLEQVNKLVDSQKEILSKSYNPPSKLVGEGKLFVEDSTPNQAVKHQAVKVNKEPAKVESKANVSVVEKDTSNEDLSSLPVDEPASIFPTEQIVERKSYPKEAIESHEQENGNEESNLWEDLNSIEYNNVPEDEKPSITEVNNVSYDEFSIDIDEITAALDDNKDFVGEEPPEPVISPKKEEKAVSTPVAQAPVVERKPAPEPKNNEEPDFNFDESDDIMGLLETLSDDVPQINAKELKEKKKKFIIEGLTSYLKVVELFRFEQFHTYLKTQDEYQNFSIKEHEIYWEVSQLILEQGISPRKFIKEKLQKHIAIILPGIMKKHWDGSIITILEIAKGHNEIKDITLIDLAIWLAQNGYK